MIYWNLIRTGCSFNPVLLSPKNRTVLQLYYYEGYSVTEISKILKISVNGVTSRLSRARSKLKLEMEAAENEKSGIIPEH